MQNLFFVFLFVFCGFVNKKSQSPINAADDTLVIQNKLGELKSLINQNLDSTLILTYETEQRAAKINYQYGVWESQIYRGRALYALGYPDSSKVLLVKVLKETQKQKCRLTEINVHLVLARVLQNDYNFQPSVDHLIQAEKLIKDSDSFELHFDVLNQLASTHRKMMNYTSALKYFNLLESRYFNQMDVLQRYILFQNKGNVYADMKKYNQTEEFFKKAYVEIAKINSPDNQAQITYNLGALFYRQKRYAEAKEYITKSLEANLKSGARIKTERCYRVLGSIYLDQKNYLKAINYYNMALEIAHSIKNPRSIMGNYHNLYLAYWDLGYYNKNIPDLDKALSYSQKYNLLKDSLYQIETAAKVIELEKKYESEKKNTQITLLERENQHQEDQIRIQHTQRNYLLLIIILVSCTLVIFVYFFYYYKKVNLLLQVQSKSILGQKEQILEQNIQLQKSLNTQNKLFSIIAHDLRSPLASIFNISQLIGFYIEDENYEELEKTKKMMDQKTGQILDLTDNLLSWAQSQTGGLKPFFMPLSLNEIFNECLELYRPIAADKNIVIDCPEQTDLVIWADRNMVRTIFRNLVNNAIKFTHPNGRMNIWHAHRMQFVQIVIQDSGIGIDKAKLETVFDVGPEKRTSGTAGEKSTGLGLSVCKEFVDVLKGKIWVESELKVGSKFTIEFLMYNPEIHQSKHNQSQKIITPASLLN